MASSRSSAGKRGGRVNLRLAARAQPALLADFAACDNSHTRIRAARLFMAIGFHLSEGDIQAAAPLLDDVPLAHVIEPAPRAGSLRMSPTVATLEPEALRERCNRLVTSRQRTLMLRELLFAGYTYWRVASVAGLKPANPDPATTARTPADDDFLGDADALDIIGDFA
jgi:hypothetical protein